MKDTTTALSVRSGGRCGDRGIKLLGLHFTPQATVLKLTDLPEGAAARILHHSELVVEELAAAPAAPKPATDKPKNSETPRPKPAKRARRKKQED